MEKNRDLEEKSQNKIFSRRGYDIQRMTKDELKVTCTHGELIITPEILGSIILY